MVSPIAILPSLRRPCEILTVYLDTTGLAKTLRMPDWTRTRIAKEHIQVNTPISLNGNSRQCTPQREVSGWSPTNALSLRDVRKAEIREKGFEAINRMLPL